MTQVSTDQAVREFITAAHFNFEKVKTTLKNNPEWLNIAYQWREGDTETAIGAAAHVGNHTIAEYLLEQGAPLDICTAAMLGRGDMVMAMLKSDPANAHAKGAHNISLMFHAAMSGDTAITQAIIDAGGDTSTASSALFGAINKGHTSMVNWLLENGADDFTVTNFKDQTPLAVAVEREQDLIIALLRDKGAE